MRFPGVWQDMAMCSKSRHARTRLALKPMAQDLQATPANEQAAPKRLFSDLSAPAKRAGGKARKTERSIHGDTR